MTELEELCGAVDGVVAVEFRPVPDPETDGEVRLERPRRRGGPCG